MVGEPGIFHMEKSVRSSLFKEMEAGGITRFCFAIP